MGYKTPTKQERNAGYLKNSNPDIYTAKYDVASIDPNKKYLLICEGLNTEKDYFEAFRVPTNKVVVHGGCNSKNALIEIALKTKAQYPDREVWCVYDMDVKPDEAATQPEDFNSSIERATKNGMKVAWSNDSFELWFLLHYQKLEACITRKEINKVLKEKWKLESFHNTAKTKDFATKLYHVQLGGERSDMQAQAIKFARAKHGEFDGRTDYANHCPCTTVYLLVEELNSQLKP
jgi:hypothetical protein